MPQPVRQLLPGVLHWTNRHPTIGVDVSSHLLTETGVLIDPLVPPEGLDWFADQGLEIREILLSCRHHLRESERYVARYGCGIHAPSTGMHAFAPSLGVTPYEDGQQLPGGVVAHIIDTLSPDESALAIPDAKALVVADGVVNYDGLRFVPDHLLVDEGEDAEPVKRGLLAQFARLLDEVDFDHLLCAHGDPIVGTGRTALRDFVARMS